MPYGQTAVGDFRTATPGTHGRHFRRSDDCRASRPGRLTGSADQPARLFCPGGGCCVRSLLVFVLHAAGTRRDDVFRRRHRRLYGIRPGRRPSPHGDDLRPRPDHSLPSDNGHSGRHVDENSRSPHAVDSPDLSAEGAVFPHRRGRRVGGDGSLCVRDAAALRDLLRHRLRRLVQRLVLLQHPGIRKSSAARWPRSTSRPICGCARNGRRAERSS